MTLSDPSSDQPASIVARLALHASVLLIFIGLLVLGLIYAWRKGALEWT